MELCGAFKCGTSTLFYVVYFLRSVMHVNGLDQYPTDREKRLPDKSQPEDYLFFYQGVEGTPGIDFPVYSHIPKTTFNCKGLESGYYADIDTDCQVFHICEEEKKISFLCPNGTIFQQSDLICEWWFKVNCSHSPLLYEESAENLRETIAKRKSLRRVHLNLRKPAGDSKENRRVNLESAPFRRGHKTVTERGFSDSKEARRSKENSNSFDDTFVDNKYKHKIKSKPIAHQKNRRFNERDFGNYQNSDYDQTTSTTTSTTSTTTTTTTTPRYVESRTYKGYQVQFPLADDLEKGPLYNNDKSDDNEEFEFQSHVTQPPNSEESQLTQESASFLKNSYNSIQETSSSNPFPNHRTTYADIKTLPYISTKTYSTISSVTPQYITTQPINNGKPFLGSRVGLKIKTTKDPLFINPQVIKPKNQIPVDDVFKLHVVSNAKNVTNSTLISSKVIEKILFAKIKPINESTTTNQPIVAATASIPTTIKPKVNRLQQETKSKAPNYAVVYGSSPPGNVVQVRFNKTTNKIGIQLGKSFGGSAKDRSKEETLIRESSKSIPESLRELRIYNISIRSTTQQPRPFEKYSYETTTAATPYERATKLPMLDYKISTASPFKFSTSPTPLRTTTPSFNENIDNMIDVLSEITNSSTKARPGLVVPPSVGPQTLHTLAVYFSNALDQVIANKGKFMEENKEKLTTLLTQMTVHGYNQLFNYSASPVSEAPLNETAIDGNPQIRQLARNFTIALSSFLNDPETFKKDLENFRPTEPPSDEIETTVDEELLNYSDADGKLFTTSRPPSPTWGFILSKSPNNFQVENSVSNTDLNTADTQSFVPGLNDVKIDDKFEDLPQDHWTTSTSATNLWQSTFSIDPVSFNEEFDPTTDVEISTEIETTTTTPDALPDLYRTREINYELRSLPKFTFNSSEVSGILIDFMNNSSDDSHGKLHRILRKLNTTEDEFLVKMREIESNPITRRLILLLISECGKNVTKTTDSIESLELSESDASPSAPAPSQDTRKDTLKDASKGKNDFQIYVDPNLREDDEDTRALQLLNTLYSIASKLGK